MLDWTQGELLEGLRCYRGGQYFEAHEHWELVWLQAVEPEKTFLQALILLAGSFHHFRRGNRNGALSMLRKSLTRLDNYPETFEGIAVENLRADLRGWLVALETELVETPAIPHIGLTS
jgi:predicted metal-dependent hydrolase